MTSAILNFKKHFNNIRLNNKSCKLHVNIVPNDGGGRFVEGRYSISGLFRREYITQERKAQQQIIINTADTTTENNLDQNQNSSANINYNGLGRYEHTPVSSSNDSNYLKQLFLQWLTLKGCKKYSENNTDEMGNGMGGEVPPMTDEEHSTTEPRSNKQVDRNVVINVYSFGAIHSRSEWIILNDETLRFLFIAELAILDGDLGIIRKPELIGYEVRYSEKYILWQGPVDVIRSAKRVDIRNLYPLSK